MTKGLIQLEEILFEGVLAIEDPEERCQFLTQTCCGNPELRARLETLVSLHDQAERFFSNEEQPAPRPGDSFNEAVAAAGDEPAEGVGTRIGRYRLLECLGAGGCGAVYLAEQLEPVRRHVALKIIRVGMGTDHIIARFEAERQTLALMDHPNIARVLDAGATLSGGPYFVMQLVDGPRITEYCDQNRLDLPARLKLFVAVCRAIQHAHQKGIIHCDIKPSNILVTRHDGVAVPKVIDFGIARAMDCNLANFIEPLPQVPIGTPAYMSPEQMDGNGLNVDSRSDIFSLGVVLYELLSGLPPRDPHKDGNPEKFHADLHDSPVSKPSDRLAGSSSEIQGKVAAERRMKPARLVRMLRGDLDAIVMKAMQVDLAKRYGTANELAEDINRFLSDEPVNASGTRRRYRFEKLVRRNKAVFAAGAVAALALAGGFGVSTSLFFREARARQEQARLRAAAEQASAVEAMLRKRAQAGETVAHAAVLIRDGSVAQADSLLAGIAMEDVPTSLESASVFRITGEWLLPQGRGEEAAKRFTAVAHAIAGVDKSNSEWISIYFVAAAAAVADAGDMEHYEDLRETVVARFSEATDPVVLDEVVKSCLIKPAEPEMLAKLAPMLEVLEEGLPWDRPDTHEQLMEAWQMLSLTLGAYRTGNFPNVEKWGRRCLQHPNLRLSRNAAVHAVLAMAFHSTGLLEEARVELVKARAAVTEHFEAPFEFETPEGGFWFDWLNARVLLHEAEELLDCPDS
jgi:eukaryotic-like serine/threonine-protein kinase